MWRFENFGFGAFWNNRDRATHFTKKLDCIIRVYNHLESRKQTKYARTYRHDLTIVKENSYQQWANTKYEIKLHNQSHSA